jgi:hypothetical protein
LSEWAKSAELCYVDDDERWFSVQGGDTAFKVEITG